MRRRSLGVALLLGLCTALLSAATASAHGLIRTADPPDGATLTESPPQVVLTFNEPVHATLSSAKVLDQAGVKQSIAHSVSPDGRTITVSLPPLPKGTYTIRWRVLSQVDGHTTTGRLTFRITEPAAAEPTAPLPAPPPVQGVGEPEIAAPAPSPAPSPVQVAFRWLGYIAVTLLAGVVFFRRFAFQPSAAIAGVTDAEARFARLGTFAAAAVIATALAEFAVIATLLLDAPLSVVVRDGSLWTLVSTTQTGLSFLVRVSMAALLLAPSTGRGRAVQLATVFTIAFLPLLAALPGGLAGLVSPAHMPHLLLAVVVAVVAASLVLERARGGAPGWTQVAIAGALLFSLPINAHAWGLGPVAVAVDWIHLVAASVWVGGLPCLLAVLRRTKGEHSHLYATVVPRFSRLAGWSLAVLVLTGAYLALLQVPNPQALRETLYGQWLAFKIVLVAGLALLGALNRFLFLPRPRREATTTAVRSRFVASLRVEVVLGAAVLLTVAVLTITPPARTVQQPAAGQPLALAGIAGDLRVGLEISPGTPGRNRFEVLVRDQLGHPVEMDRVVLRLRKIDGDTSPVTVLLARTDAGAYAAETGDLALPGYWEIEVALSRTGYPDAVTSFPFVAGSLRLDSHPDAVRLLRLAGRATEELRTWRETEQLTDGTSGVVLTRYAFQRPDRVRIESADGTTVILIAATRYVRPPGGLWTRDSLPERFAARGPAAYMQGVQRAALGREDRCPEETCRVVLWETPDGAASMAAWIGMRTFRVHRLLMVAQGHYMTSRIADFNAPLRVDAPE